MTHRRWSLVGQLMLVCLSIPRADAQAPPKPFDDFKTAFARSVAAKFGPLGTAEWDSGAALFQRSWIVGTVATGITQAAPALHITWGGIPIPANDIPPVSLQLHMQLVVIKVCDGGGCGFLSFLCDVGCFALDALASLPATALNAYLLITNGTDIGTLSASNVVVAGDVASTSIRLAADTATSRLTLNVDAKGTVHVTGRVTVDIHGAAQFELLCSQISADLNNDVSAQSIDASTGGPIDIVVRSADETQIVWRPGDISVAAHHLDLPTILQPYWLDVRRFFGCPNPLIGVLQPIATWAVGSVYHPDISRTVPSTDSLPVATIHTADLLAIHGVATPRSSPESVGIVVKAKP